MFFFQKYTLFVSRSTPGKLSCGSNFFLNENFEKIYKVIPTDLPEKMAYFSEFFHLMFFQLTLGNAVTPLDSSVSDIFVKYTLLMRVLLRHIHTHRQQSHFNLMHGFYCLLFLKFTRQNACLTGYLAVSPICQIL